MQVALRTIFAASRKEPLAAVLERIHAVIVATGGGEPRVRFTFHDAPVAGRVSSVDRVLKRLPQFAPFAQVRAVQPGGHEAKAITNVSRNTTGEQIDFASILEVARGVPRSFPFHGIALRFSIPALPQQARLAALGTTLVSGVEVTDSWWVNGRQRSVMALTIAEAEPGAKKLPAPPKAVAPIFAACGKVKKTTQLPLAALTPPASDDDIRPRMRALEAEWRLRLPEIVARAGLPHDLPPNRDAVAATTEFGSGPRKPELDAVFTPLGYDCRGGSGIFTLTRRTQGNLGVELYLDVGTWSNAVSAIFSVLGLASEIPFKASLRLPVAPRANDGQYPIGGPDNWRRIVANFAALIAELDRSFVPAVEALSGPSPEWYRANGD